jgi:hypothetical protein
MKLSVFVFVLFLSTFSFAQRFTACQIFGKIYVVTQKNLADAKVYIEESEGLAELNVFQQSNKFYADKSGQWFFTTDKREANFWVYFEPVKGHADFSIFYIDTESFAGCKQ